jgi:membrane-associated phospholipid phosphatase
MDQVGDPVPATALRGFGGASGAEARSSAPRKFRSPLDHVLRFAPLLIPILAVAAAVQNATTCAYILLAGFIASLFVSQLLVKIAKKVVRQPRPEGHEERCGTIWEPISSAYSKKPGYGMPSGHSAAAGLALAFGILVIFDESRLLSRDYAGSSAKRYGLLGGALLVSLYTLSVMVHRIVIKCHTPMQVLTGGLIGASVGTAGYFATRFLAERIKLH